MEKNVHFFHDTRGKGRPQIVLVGNGLERFRGQAKWEELVAMLAVPDGIPLGEEEKKTIPFPLLYELLASHHPAPAQLGEEDIKEEGRRLRDAMQKLAYESNDLLEKLPDLGADHIFTTNYSYCIEKAFYPKKNFLNRNIRSGVRFFTRRQQEGRSSASDAEPDKKREICYRIHTGYLAQNRDGSKAGIWHIHGESSVPGSVVLGHDRYGRLLGRMEKACGEQNYDRDPKTAVQKEFFSWPELFLYGDVYVIGFGFALCEFDLWWLLRRKQRERYADGKVYFYDNGKKEEDEIRTKLLQAHGVVVNPGMEREEDYHAFYEKALEDVRGRIKEKKIKPGGSAYGQADSI